MQHVQETNLAWQLIEAAKPQLDARECNHVFISVGAGDAFTAVRILLKLIAIKQIPLSPRLVQLCTGWLDAYALHEDYERLRVIIDDLAVTASDFRVRSTARSLVCMRNSPALSIARNVHNDRSIAAPAG
jgi:hypothetical protein